MPLCGAPRMMKMVVSDAASVVRHGFAIVARAGREGRDLTSVCEPATQFDRGHLVWNHTLLLRSSSVSFASSVLKPAMHDTHALRLL